MTEHCFICNILVGTVESKWVVTIRNAEGDKIFLCENCHGHIFLNHHIPEGRSTYDYIKYDVIWGGRNV